MKKLFLPLLAVFLLSGCMAATGMSRRYDFNRIQRLGILKFNTNNELPAGVEDIFAKYLLRRGFTVIERSQLERILDEQKLNMSGALDQETLKQIGKVLGVDALVLGSVTSYYPERREVILIRTRNRYEEPVFKKVKREQKNGTYIEVEEQVGAEVRYEDTQIPQVQTMEAQVGLVVKLVDVSSGEIIWVGSYTNEGINTHLAIEATASYLVKKLSHDWKSKVKS